MFSCPVGPQVLVSFDDVMLPAADSTEGDMTSVLTDLRTVTNIDLVAIPDENHTFGPEETLFGAGEAPCQSPHAVRCTGAKEVCHL